jgi:hypothetical protein
MSDSSRSPRGGGLELAAVLAVGVVLTVALTYPLAFKIGSVGRVDNGDGQFSIWNVAWVARTLVVDPLHVYDANIFYPHRWTLAYSESNLGAGVLAVPAYWITRNPYFAHNFVVLLAFLLTATGTYYLVRYLTGDRRAATVSAICFAFCPHVFGHLPHIQALMAAGLPFCMLAFHRLADRPTPGRGVVLGLVMAAQAISSGYYGVFVMLMVGFAVFVMAMTRRLWADRRYWAAIAIAAAVAILVVGPLFVPYVMLQRATGFKRSLEEATRFSANWSSYLASSAYAHAWLLPYLPHWTEVNFPGLVATVFGVAGIVLARSSREREIVFVYGGLTLLACWASFGPDARLYALLYDTVPVFVWLRVPSRLGLVVVFGLSVLAGLALTALFSRVRHQTMLGAAIAIVAAGELAVALDFRQVSPVAPAYRLLSTLPRGPLIEMPFYYRSVDFPQHVKYMLASTAHWMPLVNGYSDYVPVDFVTNVMTLAPFPSRDAFKLLESRRVRYAVFHMYGYNTENRNDVLARLKEFAPYLRPLYVDDETRLYEIVGYPP